MTDSWGAVHCSIVFSKTSGANYQLLGVYDHDIDVYSYKNSGFIIRLYNLILYLQPT